MAELEGDLVPNCAAPGVHIRWVFGNPETAGCEAIILEGERKGQAVLSIPHKMNAGKWDVVARNNLTAVSFAAASREDIKTRRGTSSRCTWHGLSVRVSSGS